MNVRNNEPSILPGESYPLGSTCFPEGVNFSLFCKNGTSVHLLFFDNIDDLEPAREIELNKTNNRSNHYWHAFVKGFKPGQLYAYRIDGPREIAAGHLFDFNKILLDPYSKAVAVPSGRKRSASAKSGKTDCPSMKSVVADLSTYDWEGDKRLRRAFSQTVIYEMHVGGFTRNPNSGIDPIKRGTFSAVLDKIPYLVELGINAVELLPVFQFDEQDAPDGLVNYWGYNPISFFAPHQGYSASNDPLHVLDEFRDMVKGLHAAGIEVILDVVYNHSGEGGIEGPTYNFRGIDNSIYYLLDKKDFSYTNFSGCGNTLNANQSIVRRLIIDSLHFWVDEMHVDGFRFDLASILSRDESGLPMKNPPVLWDIESDPIMSDVKLMAEAWDAAGLYQVGSFTGDNWKEWNGKFRDDIRRFLRGEQRSLSNMVTRLVGSPDLYGHEEREPEQSINFVTCHDGFTLYDLVSYEQKHNEANKENNKDGNDDNISWNSGKEGDTNDPFILQLRNRQVKNFFTLNLLSIGAPLISMGDEVCRTQFGNNNAYCQNNEISWFDWNSKAVHSDIFRFVRLLIHGRLQRDSAQAEFAMSLNQLLKNAEISWHGVKLNQPDWSDQSHSISFTVKSMSRNLHTHFLINAWVEPLTFELPQLKEGRKWRSWIDTTKESPLDISSWNETTPISTDEYAIGSYSIAVLVAFQ